MTWLFRRATPIRVRHYIPMMIMVLFSYPALFGIRYTTVGYLFNFLWADFILYSIYGFQDKIKNNKKDDDADNTF